MQRLHLRPCARHVDAGASRPTTRTQGGAGRLVGTMNRARRLMTARQRDERVEVAELVARRRLLRERDAECRRQHADDGERRAADLHRLSDDARLTAESTLEQAVRQHEPLLVVIRRQAAEHGLRSRDRPEISADRRDPFLARLAAHDQVEILRAVGGHLLEELRLLPPDPVVAARAGGVAPAARLCGAIQTSRSGSGYGSGRSSTACTRLNTAVFSPIPSASVTTATVGDERRPHQLAQPELRVEKKLIDGNRHGVCRDSTYWSCLMD